MRTEAGRLTQPGFRQALVTGGAGFIGSRLVRALLEQGLAVTVLDDLSTGTRAALDPRAALIEGDVRKETDARRALSGADCVFHLAARVSVRASFAHFYDDIETNLLGTCNLLCCLPESIRRFVFASSMAVYAEPSGAEGAALTESDPREPISPYGIGKLSGEQLCSQVLAERGIPFTALRYFNTYGPGQRFTPYVGVVTIFTTRLLRGEGPVVFGDGEQQRDFVHVDDIVAGTLAALGGAPGTYNLGTGRATSIRRLAELLVSRIHPGLPLRYAPAQPGELRHAVADIGAARARLGYRPLREFERELDAVIGYIKSSV